MPYNGSGVFSLVSGNPVITGTIISSTWANNTLSDIANNGLTNALTKDGQQTPTGNIKLGGFQLNGVGNGTTRDAAPNISQIQDGTLTTLSGVSGTNALVASSSPAVVAYANGQCFDFLAVSVNTGDVTLNINSLGAKAILKAGVQGLVQLSPSDLQIGQNVRIRYDGTQFQVISQLPVSAQLPFRNKLINGRFDIWQIAGPFNSSGAVVPFADRWYFTSGTSGTCSISQGSIGPGDPVNQGKYYANIFQTVGGATAPGIEQRIESVRTLAGRTVTVTVTANNISGPNPINVGILIAQIFGTGGSTTVSTSSGNLTFSAGTSQTKSVTFVIPSISGKTVSSSGDDYLRLSLTFPSSTTFNIAISQIQMEEGSPTPFENRPISVETSLVQRYRTVFSSATQAVLSIGKANATNNGFFAINLPSAMRVLPTLSSGNLNTDGAAGTASAINFFSGNTLLLSLGVAGTPFTVNQGLVLSAGNGAGGSLILTDPVL